MDKFGTCHRDATTGLDYADQRYFTGLTGRFLTSDPYEASGGAAEPVSWNRYPYVGGDPVNNTDRTGLAKDCRVQNGTVSCTTGDSVTVEAYAGGILAPHHAATRAVKTAHDYWAVPDPEMANRQLLMGLAMAKYENDLNWRSWGSAAIDGLNEACKRKLIETRVNGSDLLSSITTAFESTPIIDLGNSQLANATMAELLDWNGAGSNITALEYFNANKTSTATQGMYVGGVNAIVIAAGATSSLYTPGPVTQPAAITRMELLLHELFHAATGTFNHRAWAEMLGLPLGETNVFTSIDQANSNAFNSWVRSCSRK